MWWLSDPYSVSIVQCQCKQASIMIEWTLNDLTNANEKKKKKNRKRLIQKIIKTNFIFF